MREASELDGFPGTPKIVDDGQFPVQASMIKITQEEYEILLAERNQDRADLARLRDQVRKTVAALTYALFQEN